MPFLRLLRCKMQATSKMTASISSRLAMATPIANFRIDIQNSSSIIDCFVVDSSPDEKIVELVDNRLTHYVIKAYLRSLPLRFR